MELPNLEYIKETSGGDKDFENSLLAILKEELPKEIDSFKKHITDELYLEASLDVHKIKHKLGLLNMTKTLELASEFELDLKNNDLKQYKNFISIFDRILVYLDNN
ncbi:Hpt domain-containing protein [Polaribacter tangerinus]|uniref:Hpt domain-containing protein n=1 Tax=Polaribacter tangerinus TaxID=1920034 RepID=UPI000B4BD9C4|nr:Hpt domain-containing protein [Polaribacter tangerinus]